MATAHRRLSKVFAEEATKKKRSANVQQSAIEEQISALIAERRSLKLSGDATAA